MLEKMSIPGKKVLLVVALLLAGHPIDAAPLFEYDAIFEAEMIGPLQTLVDSKQDDEQMELPVVLRAEGGENVIAAEFERDHDELKRVDVGVYAG